jgi:glycosyltransferase involved in cell wall biosynthesis
MRVLYHHRSLADGAEGIHIAEMVKAFRSLGVQCEVFGPVPESTKTASRQKWSEHLTRAKNKLPSILLEVGEIAFAVLDSVRLAWHVASVRPDVIYDRYALYSFGAAFVGKLFGIPTVLEVNSPLSYEKQHYERLVLRRLARRAEQKICQAATRVACVSTPLKGYLVGLGVNGDRVRVIPNGADPERFGQRPDSSGLRTRLGIREGPTIGFVGVMREWHGLDLLLDAFVCVKRLHPSAQLVLVGDGPYQKNLETRCARETIRDVLFTGRVRSLDVGNIIQLFDVAVSPHATFYASPMKLVEYMAASRAVVAPRMDNITDIIEEGTDGKLFAPGNIQSLVEAILALLEDDAERRRLGQRARIKVETHRNWKAIASEILAALSPSQRSLRKAVRSS